VDIVSPGFFVKISCCGWVVLAVGSSSILVITSSTQSRRDGGAAPRRTARMRTDQVFRWCLADCHLMAGAYEMLAADCTWMFDDDALANGRAINLPATARLLQRINRTGAVLDAACGTGVDAAVLARRARRRS
jgi:hypothetical protein